jgi:8-oxo-dGTP diphosphatase
MRFWQEIQTVSRQTRMIHVVTGVIYNAQRQVLIALRPPHTHLGGLWEFPGGKVEAKETPQQALTRELREEIGIVPIKIRPLDRVSHTYPDRVAVELDVWWVDEFTGEPRGLEGQEVRWVAAAALTTLEFPAACRTIIATVQNFLS